MSRPSSDSPRPPRGPRSPRLAPPARGGRRSNAVSGPVPSPTSWWPVVGGAVVVAVAGWWWMSRPPGGTVAPLPAPSGNAPGPVTQGPADSDMTVPDQLPGGAATPTAVDSVPPASDPSQAPVREESASAEKKRPTTPVVEFPGALDLNPVTSASAEAVRLRAFALGQAFKAREWSGYTALLGRSVAEAAQRRTSAPPRPDEVTALLKQPVFSQILVQHALLSRILDAKATAVLDSSAHRPFVDQLLSDPALGEALLISLTRDDKLDAVLNTWADLWAEHEAARTTHVALGLACALVFEKPASLTWNDQPLRLTANERFAWFVQQDAAGRLTGKIEKLSAADLAWVVCAPVPESELEWALKKMNLKQDAWGQAYGMVKYDMEKAVKGTNSYEAYTFSEILEKGGICGDQSYFAANTARAHGIPAAVVTGDGARGPHAWIRWMDRDGVWNMQGRFDGYALGSTQHAQNNRSLSEEWFVQRSERKAADTEAVASSWHRLWIGRVLEIAGDARRAGPFYDLAATANRELPDVAEAQLRHWLAYRAGAPVEEWRDLAARIKKNFRENSGLMALVQRAEEEMIFPRQDSKAVVADLRRDVRQMEKEAAKDGVAPKDEELAKSYARQAEVLLKSGDVEGVRSLYRRALDDRGNAATFKILARDYFRSVRDHPEARARACRDLEIAWNRHVDTGGDYFDIGSQNSALAVIIKCYREAGDTEKADRLQKELDRRQGKAERKAL